MRTLKTGVLLASVLLLTACSTASKRAGEFMEKGLYDDAIRTYEGILQKNPNDTDAVAGLKKARAGWLDRRLIDVRMARLAGSSDKALDILLEVSGRETQWKTEPGGNVAFTQNEETSYGIAYAEKISAESVAQKLPLKAEYFLLKYKSLFGGNEVARRYDGVRARVKTAGKASCTSYLPAKVAAKKKPDPMADLATKHPYYYHFLRAYCDYWGVTTPEPPAAAEKFHEGFVDELQVSALGVMNLPADIRVYIADGAKAAFERTAWHDAEGTQPLALNVAGGYTFADSRVPQRLSHVYTVQEPYTEYADVQKSRAIPYTVVENALDPISNASHEHTVTKYRTEYYTEKEPQTRYRDVQRTYHYDGWQHDRKITLALSAQVALEKHPLQLELSEVSQTGGTESDIAEPSIGLTPQHPALEDPPGWLKTQSNRFVAQFEQKLAALWKEAYCQGTGVEDVAILGDSVQKCLRQTLAETPPFVDSWYQKNFGVGAREATSVIGVNK